METEGGKAHIVPSIHRGGAPISSTRIRAALAAGNCEEATLLLGRPYTLTLPVLRGASLGATLGFPTANQCPPASRMIPANGVYRTTVTLPGGEVLDGVTDVGTRPTVGGTETRIETHILDYTGDLYGQRLQVAFHARLRGEMTFPSLDALRAQIETDALEVRTWRTQNGHN
jgi:riboflavin kinase/FMN adenylyltransferase